ncbi:hypothetical protein FOVG_18282 [Fusarium oxysporum f. sp. pisi HDV247]|jgi:hypothetical protein|uniref:Uncharacterized protein n=1 Tax=Fusarium oxysporum f. sp. pisi HDV247 TaxID=1080344 RepID=W9NJZ3_FUSOX|nr:hypothetical protein FOVG_18282 [Fusarium oxysporum f. sp. pisi HDV247]
MDINKKKKKKKPIGREGQQEPQEISVAIFVCLVVRSYWQISEDGNLVDYEIDPTNR